MTNTLIKNRKIKSPSARHTCWTPERRAAQAARLRASRIWQYSTGPKTSVGKACSRMNPLKTGQHTAAQRQVRATLALQRRVLRNMRCFHAQMARFPQHDHSLNNDTLRQCQHLTAILMPVVLDNLRKGESLTASPKKGPA